MDDTPSTLVQRRTKGGQFLPVLAETEYTQILLLHAAGVSKAAIGREFGVHRNAITRILESQEKTKCVSK
jgi:hypothetical protein